MAASESGEIHLVPDILENMEGNFFPVFSNERAMGEYGKDFIHVKRNMPDAIRLERCNALKPSVIILNPFTRALEIPEELWHTLEKQEKEILSIKSGYIPWSVLIWAVCLFLVCQMASELPTNPQFIGGLRL